MKVEITLNFFFNLSETRDQRLKMIRHNNKMSCYWLLCYNVMVPTPSMASCRSRRLPCVTLLRKQWFTGAIRAIGATRY